MSNNQKLTDTVNQSGFPLQIGLTSLVQRTNESHGWRAIYTEHSWRNDADQSSGFIDIVLEDEHQVSVLVIECKRVLESSWIFLVDLADNPQIKYRKHAKLWISSNHGDTVKHFDWHDAAVSPSSPESAFCVVPGQDARNKPMLERVAGELVSATEAFASAERMFRQAQPYNLRMYGSVIVTTATLQVCAFDSNTISMADGKIADAQFKDVPFVRFRKPLSVRVPKLPSDLCNQWGALAKAKEHTVFVVNASALEQFIREWDVDGVSIKALL